MANPHNRYKTQTNRKRQIETDYLRDLFCTERFERKLI